MARIYPVLILIITLVVGSILTYKFKMSAVNAIDEENWLKESKSNLNIWALSQVYFWDLMFLGMPLVQFLVNHKDYLTELFQSEISCQAFWGYPFGAIMQGLVNAGIKQAKSQAGKVTNQLKTKKNPGFPAWIFRSKEETSWTCIREA